MAPWGIGEIPNRTSPARLLEKSTLILVSDWPVSQSREAPLFWGGLIMNSRVHGHGPYAGH